MWYLNDICTHNVHMMYTVNAFSHTKEFDMQLIRLYNLVCKEGTTHLS